VCSAPIRRAAGRRGGPEQAGQRVRRLSGGQRRRLDVAIGIVGHPELLFLDEPTAGFDPEARREFHDLVHRLADREEATILLTTHDLDEAEKLADRILILAAGRIIADGSADEPTRFVRELFRQYGESVEDLEVRRASLEDTYMALVRQAESERYGAGLGGDDAIAKFTVVAG
jgi:ABC-2 type transport system ATP-binding protein